MTVYEQYALGLATEALQAGDAAGRAVDHRTAYYTKAAALASLAVLAEVRKLRVAVEGSAR